MLLAASIAAGVIMAALLYRLFFKDFHDFMECLRFYFQPDFISMFRGELLDDWWGSTKLGVWIALSLVMAAATFCKLPELFPSLQSPTVARINAIKRAHGQTKRQPTREFVRAENEPRTTPVSNAISTAAASPVIAAQAPEPSGPNDYGVKVGDMVAISAVTPAIALRRATITSINNEQFTVRSGFEDYTVRWKDVMKLKPAN